MPNTKNIIFKFCGLFQVSLKFRDPLSRASLHDHLIPTRRITTKHEDINAYVQRAGGLNEALLSVISEKDAMRYSEAHVSFCNIDMDCW